MVVPFGQIFHLERFRIENEEFIKISEPITFGGSRPKTTKDDVNAIHRPGVKKFVYFSPETLVRRK